MKEHLRLMALFAALLTVIPLISLFGDHQAVTAETDLSDTVDILFTETGEVRRMPMKSYLIGAVFAQMPASFEDEALKAQAVLAHTYALRRYEEEKLSPTAELKGALFSDDTEKYQAYFTPEQAKAYYGAKYTEVYKKIEAAAEYASYRYLSFEGKPIIAAFHAISCGKTRSALEAWGQNVPYLASVDSSCDSGGELFLSEKKLTADELSALIKKEFPDADISDAKPDIRITERTESGCAKTAELCGRVYISADALAKAVGLPSPSFEVSAEGDVCTFTCKGRGHLVGMSQYGADSMAASGKSCEEILSHYFPSTVMINTKPVK